MHTWVHNNTNTEKVPLQMIIEDGEEKSDSRTFIMAVRGKSEQFLIGRGWRIRNAHYLIFESESKKTLDLYAYSIFFRKVIENFRDIYMRGEKTEKMKKQNWKKIQFKMQFHNEFGTSNIKKLVYHMNSRVRFLLLRFTLRKHIFKTSISFVKNKVIIVWGPRGSEIIVFLSIRYWY
jgi:hypothetical protein